MTAASATTPIPERRREHRVSVRLPMLVRGTARSGEWFEERTASENLCRGGAAFATRYSLDIGMGIEITIPGASPTAEPDTDFCTHGRVIHLAPGKTDRERIVGVQFTGPRFHRIFVPETTA